LKVVERLEVLSLAHGRIRVERSTKPLLRVTIEVRDEDRHRFLRAAIYGNEARDLLYFLIPVVVERLKGDKAYYESIIQENEEAIKKTIDRKHTVVPDFKDSSLYGGQAHLELEKAQEKLKEQKERLEKIKDELFWLGVE